MEKVTRIPHGRKSGVISYIVMSDLHEQYVDLKALSLVEQAIDRIPKGQRRIILLGDIFDLEWLCSANPSYQQAQKFKDYDGYFVPEMQASVSWFDRFYDRIRKWVVKPEYIYFMCGNHEGRLYRQKFLYDTPVEYRKWFDLEYQLGCAKKKMRFFRYNTWLKLTPTHAQPLLLTHGQRCGMNVIKKHFLLANAGVMFGHTHELGVAAFHNVEQTIMGYNNPCLCIQEMPYMEGKVNNWSQGYSELHSSERSNFVLPLNIWNNELIIDGVKLRGKRISI